jgi:hypothetical protein
MDVLVLVTVEAGTSMNEDGGYVLLLLFLTQHAVNSAIGAVDRPKDPGGSPMMGSLGHPLLAFESCGGASVAKSVAMTCVGVVTGRHVRRDW